MEQMIHKMSDGRYIVVLDEEWVSDGSRLIEARSESELKTKIANAVRVDDRWITINGSHVLVNGSGKMVRGAGGKFNGMLFGTRFKDYSNAPVKGKKLVRFYGGATARRNGEVIKGRGKRQKQVDKAVKITKASEAKAALEKMGFKHAVDGKKIDGDLLVKSVNQLSTLDRKFKVLKEANVQFDTANSGGGTIAYVRSLTVNPREMTLNLCPSYYKSHKSHVETVQRDIDIKYSVPCSKNRLAEYGVTHEYGHMLANILKAKRFEQDGWSEEKPGKFIDSSAFSGAYTPSQLSRAKKKATKWYDKRGKEVVDTARREICKIAGVTQKEAKEKGLISRYGETNGDEWFAEVFANSQLGEPNVLGDAMNIWLKRKGLVNE